MADRTIDIKLQVENAGRAALQQAAGDVKRFNDAARNSARGSNVVDQGGVAQIAKAVVSLQALSGAAHAARAAMAAYQTAVADGASATEAAVESLQATLESLPAGIGEAAKLGREIGEEISGIADLKRQAAAADQEYARRAKEIAADESRRAKAKAVEAQADAIAGELRIARAADVQRELIRVEVETQRRIDAIQREAAKAGAVGVGARAAEALRELQAERVREIEAKNAEQGRKIAEAAAKETADIRRRAAEAETAARVAELRGAGQIRDAELLETRKHYERLIAEAKSYDEANALRRQQQAAEAAIRNRPAGGASRSAIEAISVSSSFQGAAARYSAGNEVSVDRGTQRDRAIAERAARDNERTAKAVEEMLRQMSRNRLQIIEIGP